MLHIYQHDPSEAAASLDDPRSEIAKLQEDSIAFRRHERHEVNQALILYGGELSEESKIEGICRDFSQSGLGAVLQKAPQVGEEVWLIAEEFKPLQSPVHALCVRCRLLPCKAFEAGFIFLAPVTLPE